MYISESFLEGFIVIVVMIVLLIWAIRKSNKSDMKHNKPKSETPKYASEDKEPSDLKYDNEVYISFKNKIQKAYEIYDKTGLKIAWCSDNEGFIILEADSASVGSTIYNVEVHYDDQNTFKLNDPFFIVVSFGILFDRCNYDRYEEKAVYLNKETKNRGIFYAVDTMGFSLGVYYCHIVVTNNNNLCKRTKELGEAELFRRLMCEAREYYYEGEEIYCNKLSRDAVKNFSN